MATLALRGERLDPDVEVPVQIIAHWARRAWEGTLPSGAGLWWERNAREATTKAGDMRKVTGPIGAMLHHLHEIGWAMVDPNTLRDQYGIIMDLRETSPSWVAQKARNEARDTAWLATTTTRRGADGVNWGVDLAPAKEALAKVTEENPELVRQVENLIRGATWAQDRRN